MTGVYLVSRENYEDKDEYESFIRSGSRSGLWDSSARRLWDGLLELSCVIWKGESRRGVRIRKRERKGEDGSGLDGLDGAWSQPFSAIDTLSNLLISNSISLFFNGAHRSLSIMLNLSFLISRQSNQIGKRAQSE